MRNAWRPFVNYILYNNSFTLIVVFLLLSGGTVLAANDDVREALSEAMVSSEDTLLVIDNSFIIDANLESFDFRVQVSAIEEDDDNYYISYTYRTIEVLDGTWQEVEKEESFQVSKAQLGETDLGLYIAEELKEFVDEQKRLLAETQQIEINLGRSGKVVERKYAGLIGRFLDTEEVTFEGYDPVVKEPVKVAATDEAEETTDGEGEPEPEASTTENSSNETPGGGDSSTGAATSTTTSTTTDTASTATSTATSTELADTTAPVITLNGEADVELTVGDSYSEPGASASDDTDGDLTSTVVTSGSVDTETAGTYEITYNVSDSAGNSTDQTRTVTVVQAPEPEPEPVTQETATST